MQVKENRTQELIRRFTTQGIDEMSVVDISLLLKVIGPLKIDEIITSHFINWLELNLLSIKLSTSDPIMMYQMVRFDPDKLLWYFSPNDSIKKVSFNELEIHPVFLYTQETRILIALSLTNNSRYYRYECPGFSDWMKEALGKLTVMSFNELYHSVTELFTDSYCLRDIIVNSLENTDDPELIASVANEVQEDLLRISLISSLNGQAMNAPKISDELLISILDEHIWPVTMHSTRKDILEEFLINQPFETLKGIGIKLNIKIDPILIQVK